MSEPKRLYRDVQNGKIGGVAAGTAEYLNLDVTLMRLLFVVLLLVTGGAMLVAYIVAWLVVPPRPPQQTAAPVPRA